MASIPVSHLILHDLHMILLQSHVPVCAEGHATAVVG